MKDIIHLHIVTDVDFCGGAEDESQFCTYFVVYEIKYNPKTKTKLAEFKSFKEAMQFCKTLGDYNPKFTCEALQLLHMVDQVKKKVRKEV